MPKKSNHDLTRVKMLKVPIKLFHAYRKEYGRDDWAEQARDVLDMATGAFPLREENKQ